MMIVAMKLDLIQGGSKMKEIKVNPMDACVMCGCYVSEGITVCKACQKKYGGKYTKVIYKKGNK